MGRKVDFPLPANGVNNRANETALPAGAIREGVNIDIDNAGRFRMRRGYTLRTAGGGMHSLFYSAAQNRTFVAQGRSFCTIAPDDLSLTPIGSLKSSLPLDYTEYNGNVYFVSPYSSAIIHHGEDAPRPIGVRAPDVTPTVVADEDGGLRAGTYNVAFTYINDRGEEGAASSVQQVDVPNGGALSISDLAGPANWAIRIYVSAADGERLRRAADVPTSIAACKISNPATGEECPTLNLRPLTTGQLITWHNGRLVVASGNEIVFSNPLRPHLYNRAKNTIPFQGEITLLESVTTGLFVGDDRGVWFLDGADPSNTSMSLVSTYRPFPRSGIKIEQSNFDIEGVSAGMPVAVWMATNGYNLGTQSGGVVQLNENALRIPAGQSGRSAYVTHDGVSQVVTLTGDTSTDGSGVAEDSEV